MLIYPGHQHLLLSNSQSKSIDFKCWPSTLPSRKLIINKDDFLFPAQCNRSILETFRPLFVSTEDKTQLNATGEGGGKSAEINISAYKNYLLCNPNLLNVIVCSCAFVCLNTATDLYSYKINARST